MWAADKFVMLMWLVYLLLYAVQSLSILQTTFALCLLLNFCTIEYLVLHERFCMHKQSVIFHLIICFFYLLYCNTYNKINKSKITLVFCLLLALVRWNIVFTYRNIFWPKPYQLDYLLLPC